MQTNPDSVFCIEAKNVGTRLDSFLASVLSDLSRTRIALLIDQDRALVNNKVAKKNCRLCLADVVTLSLEGAEIGHRAESIEAQDIPISIVWEDDHYAVIDKPAGLVVHPGCGNGSGTLANGLKFHFDTLSSGSEADRPGIVHRLDKDTSGLLLVAKSDHAHKCASEMFANRTIEKEYIGIVIGEMPCDHELIEAPIGRSRKDPLRFCVRMLDGKPSSTEYWLLAHRAGVSVLRFRLHTGRTHQIRVHCAYKKFPIIQDSLYGGGRDAVMGIEPLDRPFVYSIYKSIGRQALHAAKLSFVHPILSTKISLVGTLPTDLLNALAFFDHKTPWIS